MVIVFITSLHCRSQKHVWLPCLSYMVNQSSAWNHWLSDYFNSPTYFPILEIDKSISHEHPQSWLKFLWIHQALKKTWLMWSSTLQRSVVTADSLKRARKWSVLDNCNHLYFTHLHWDGCCADVIIFAQKMGLNPASCCERLFPQELQQAKWDRLVLMERETNHCRRLHCSIHSRKLAGVDHRRERSGKGSWSPLPVAPVK